MKKTMKMMLAMMAGAMVFTACSSDDILENIENNEVTEAPSQLKPMTFTAIQEGQGTTRAAIDGLDIKWTAGDKISIFDGSNAYGGDQMFTIENGAGTTSATFTGSAASSDTYYALYPYAVGTTSVLRVPTKEEAEAAAGSCSSSLDFWKEIYPQDSEYILESATYMLDHEGVSEENKTIVLAYIKEEPTTLVTPGVELDGSSIKNVVIPAEQTATAGSADSKAMIMVAKGDDANTLAFKNVCAYVKVTPKFNCAAICLKSKGAQNLAGKIDINYNDGEPTTTVTADGTNTVYLVGTISAGNAYYIAVRPEALASGFTIEFLTADKEHYYARSTSKALNLTRSNVKNLGEFTTTGTWTISSPTTGNDGAGHNWMLIAPTLKISTPTEFGYGVAYNDLVPWDGWAVPTADELSEAGKSGAFGYDYDVEKIFIKGTGVLKYGKIHHVNNIRWYFWTSTPYDSPYFSGYQTTVLIRDGSITGASPSSADDSGYIFKYNN